MTLFYQEPEFLHKIITIIKDANTILRNERSTFIEIELRVDSNGKETKITSGYVKANDFIMEKLKEINRDLEHRHVGHYNIISRETASVSYEKRNGPYIAGTWFVAPLDGTEDYCDNELKNPYYTCNIGLVVEGNPVFGIFSHPESGVIYYGIKDVGSFKILDEMYITYETACPFPGLKLQIAEKNLKKSGILVATSKSDLTHDTKSFLDTHLNDVTCKYYGSAVKFGNVADGTVDIYPRFGPSNEWETCAADAVVRYAGGGVYIYNPKISPLKYSEMLKYNKTNLSNPYFVAY